MLAWSPPPGAGDLVLAHVRHVSLRLGIAFVSGTSTAVVPLHPWVGVGPHSAVPRPGTVTLAQALHAPDSPSSGGLSGTFESRPRKVRKEHYEKGMRLSSSICIAAPPLLGWPGPPHAVGQYVTGTVRVPRGFVAAVLRPGAPPSGPRRRTRASCELERTWETSLLRALRTRSVGSMSLSTPPSSWLTWVMAPGPLWIFVPTREQRQHVAREMARYVPGVSGSLEIVDQEVWRTWVQVHMAATWQPRVPLPGGGTLMVERNEACWAVDVNSGRGEGSHANQQALLCLSQQMILRSMDGVILVDLLAGPLDALAWARLLAGDPAHPSLLAWEADGWVRLVRPRRVW